MHFQGQHHHHLGYINYSVLSSKLDKILSSLMDILSIKSKHGDLLFILAYFSIDKVPRVSSPVLVIHGTEDEVIDFSHGLAIYEK